MSYNNNEFGSDDDESENEDSTAETFQESTDDSSSSGTAESAVQSECDDIDVDTHKGANILLNIHHQLDLDKLQKMKRFFIADDDTSGMYAELGMKEFSDALRSVLPDIEELTDEDLHLLFTKIDVNGSGDVDWDEFTGFLLQLDEGNRNMAAAAQMSDLKPLPASQRAGGDHTGQHRNMIEKVINVERPGISAYVTCSRDGTIKFWNKGTFAHFRTIRHLDAMKAAYETMIMGGKGREVEGNGRRVCSAPVIRVVKSMKSAWVYDIQQMPLSNRIAAACFDRTVTFYDILTGEFICRIGGLRSSPICVDCVEIGSYEQQVVFGDLDGVLHVWSFGKHFYIPGLQDTREAAELNGNYSLPLHVGAISCVGYVGDLNAVVTCGMDGKIYFFDLMKRRVTRTFGGHVERPIFAFAYSKRHRFVVSAGMGRAVVFWNSYTMNVLARRDGHAANVRHCLVDDRSDRVITISADKSVRCWDSSTFRCIQSFKDHRMHRPDDTITAALWDHSRSSLVIAGIRLGVWKNKGAIQSTKHTHESPVTAALYNSHFHQVVSADSMGNVHVWLVETGLLAFRFGNAHGTSKISSMGFDASERRLLTGANDGTVKMWNFNNGKELLLLRSERGSGEKPDKANEGNERNEVSGLVYCRDGKESVDYVATCSWDKQVRLFTMASEDHHHPDAKQRQQQHDQQQNGGEATNVTTAIRVFPGEDRLVQQQRHHGGGGTPGKSGGAGGSWEEDSTKSSVEGHSADILAIAHCGCQQVATAGCDGQIFMWATESGKAKFSMKPSDHDVSTFDEVSSIGGLTSVAQIMVRQRRKKGRQMDGDSVDSGGYPERMGHLLAEDTSISRISWDGREYFAEERMGGGNDGSGTGQIAEDANDQDPEDESAAGAIETAAAETAPAAAAGPRAEATGEATSLISVEQATSGDGSMTVQDNDGVVTEGVATRKGGALSSPDQTTVEPASGEGAATPSEHAADGVDKGGLGAPVLPPLASASAINDSGEVKATLEDHLKAACGVVQNPGWEGAAIEATQPQPESPEDAAVAGAGKEKGVEKHSESGQGWQAMGEGGSDAASKGIEELKKAAARRKEEGGVEELLESTESSSVDCLVFIKCHNALCSSTASGELHFWDAPSGAFIFGVAARHPNNPGLTAMSSNEGPIEGGGGGSNPDSSVRLITAGTCSNGGGGGVTTNTATAAAVGEGVGGCASLMLYTACEEGFVKTWKVGNITEYAYQKEIRARPKPPRKLRVVRGGKERNAGEGEAQEPAGATTGIRNSATQQFSLLQPMHQWQAHKTTITSIGGGNFRAKLDLLITAGDDCYVHVWTSVGAHVGTFGQPTAWSLGSRATWREPTDQALCSAHGRGRAGEDHEQSSSAASASATAVASTTGQQESKSTPQGGSKRVRRMASKNGAVASQAAGNGEKEPRKGRKQEDEGKRIAEDRDLEKKREETERYQEKRYYTASQNRVQRKLLRERLSAFCVSRDYYKKEKIQEAIQILSETGKKNSLHPQPSAARPVLSKHRITSILRNTYNQVSFQLRLHTHEDVHERAETALTRRKSRRRAKASTAHGSNSSNAAGHHHHPHHHGGTPGMNRRSSVTTAAATAPSTPHTAASTGADGDGCDRNANTVENAKTPTRNDQSDGCRGGGGGFGGTPVASGNTDGVAKDHEGGTRPAIPVDPPSSAATSSRGRFRRTSTTVG